MSIVQRITLSIKGLAKSVRPTALVPSSKNALFVRNFMIWKRENALRLVLGFHLAKMGRNFVDQKLKVGFTDIL